MQRILIVEDEQKTGRYLQQGLVEEGYQADLFNNGRDGLGAASKGQYDLIILDVMLPFLDGWQNHQRTEGVRARRTGPVFNRTRTTCGTK
ncbi:DNA-binding transcriptional activator CusR [Citrobacter koseri]|uniref:DNA-binding transcriptional activator CusR n=1 Tax=Citrobacter koseri TaxID=545 RepID=A0A3S4I7N9_CITKO|nr:DNA-binding transcriptional activator CusR [Citrobacter koseri]